MKYLSLINKYPSLKYLIVGGTSFLLDLSILYILYEILNINIAIAGTIAFWIGVAYNFTLTRYWTFSIKQNNNIKKHVALYAGLLCFNYLSTILILSALSNSVSIAILKTAIVAMQTMWNYPIYKYFIFKK